MRKKKEFDALWKHTSDFKTQNFISVWIVIWIICQNVMHALRTGIYWRMELLETIMKLTANPNSQCENRKVLLLIFYMKRGLELTTYRHSSMEMKNNWKYCWLYITEMRKIVTIWFVNSWFVWVLLDESFNHCKLNLSQIRLIQFPPRWSGHSA